MRRSVLIPTTVASGVVVTSQRSEALAIPLIWGVGLIGISLGLAAKTIWNAITSQSANESDFPTKSRGESSGDEFDDPDYLDSIPLSMMSGPLSKSARDAMQWNVLHTSSGAIKQPTLNRVEAQLLPEHFEKRGTILVPVTNRRPPTARVESVVAEAAGKGAEVLYTRLSRPKDGRPGQPYGYQMAVYAFPRNSNQPLGRGNVELGMATITDHKHTIAAQDVVITPLST